MNLETPPNYIIGEYVPHGWEEIELRGDLATSVGPNAIEAGANDDAIYIHFNQNLGNVSIKICNTTGVFVYNTVDYYDNLCDILDEKMEDLYAEGYTITRVSCAVHQEANGFGHNTPQYYSFVCKYEYAKHHCQGGTVNSLHFLC